MYQMYVNQQQSWTFNVHLQTLWGRESMHWNSELWQLNVEGATGEQCLLEYNVEQIWGESATEREEKDV